jgi:hypothetical protein
MTEYKSQPLSDAMEQRIRVQVNKMKDELAQIRHTAGPSYKTPNPTNPLVRIARLEGNIGALEWVLRDAEFPT